MISPDSGIEHNKENASISSPPVKRRRLSTTRNTPRSLSRSMRELVSQKEKATANFSLNVDSTALIVEGTVEGNVQRLAEADWKLRVQRIANQDDGGEIMVEASLVCIPPSSAWKAQCQIDLVLETGDKSFDKTFTCELSSAKTYRGMRLRYKDNLVNGGKLTASLTVSRVCNKFLIFPNFDNPQETGNDELIVQDVSLFVDRNLLSIHSPVLRCFFSTQSPPFQMDSQFRLQDVVNTLRTLYPQKGIIDAKNVGGVAKTAHLLQLWDTLQRCESFISNCSSFSLLDKLDIATQFDMLHLQMKCREELDDLPDSHSFHPLWIGCDGICEKTKAFLFDFVMERMGNEIEEKKRMDEVSLNIKREVMEVDEDKEEKGRKEEEERVRKDEDEKRRIEEEERRRIEEEERTKKEEEERIRKEEEEKERKRNQEELLRQELRQKMKREEEERRRREKEEEDRRIAEEAMRIEKEEEEEIMRMEEERRFREELRRREQEDMDKSDRKEQEERANRERVKEEVRWIIKEQNRRVMEMEGVIGVQEGEVGGEEVVTVDDEDEEGLDDYEYDELRELYDEDEEEDEEEEYSGERQSMEDEEEHEEEADMEEDGVMEEDSDV